jgi:hypothetical protein
VRISSPRTVAAVLFVIFLALHLRFLPASLEDLDSINFALGLRRFDVAAHQPHPPGYPVYMAIGKAVHAVVPDEARALGLISIVAGGLGIFAFMALFRQLDASAPWQWPVAASLMTVTSPLYWFAAVRPLSDVPGLAAATGVQALTLAAKTVGGVVAAAFLSGLVSGMRSQAAWLTVPLLAWIVVRRPWPYRTRVAVAAAGGFAAGCAVWAIPLVALTGGPAAYWRALSDQGAEDLTGIQMLWTTPTLRQFVLSLYYAFIAPWVVWQTAAAILVVASVGAAHMLWHSRPSLIGLAVAFGPYLVFDLLFQETFTSRYALPLVAPLAYLATRAVAEWSQGIGLTLTAGIAVLNAMLAGLAVQSYSAKPAPVFRMLDDMRIAARSAPPGTASPVLAMHRREELDTRRPMRWLEPGLPPFVRRLPAPPKHEWLELVKYWNSGGTSPAWFVADPLRTDLALIDDPPGSARSYDWPIEYPVLVGGVRPGNMEWHVLEAPSWYLGEGWALTPETAGVAAEDRRGPGIAPIDGWIRRRAEALTVMIGGRNLAPETPSHVTVRLEGRPLDELDVPPGAFLRFLRLPAGRLDAGGRHAHLSVSASNPQLAVEQFDAQSAGRVVFGFGDGWHEREYNPATGRMWRWMSERGVIRVRGEGHALQLTLAGETERFARPSQVAVRVGSRAIAHFTIGRQFSIDTMIPAALLGEDESAIAIETDQVAVPAERTWRSRDRRRLGLRVYDYRLRPAS